ncbi:hypothetical protein EV13_1962 [Prochlorococcus sp. MIT 0702]|nr:hypothetical protein EV13_1962 [Prochlorococcus sp. MIT 0702]
MPEKEPCHSSISSVRVVPFYFQLKCSAAIASRALNVFASDEPDQQTKAKAPAA